MYGVGLAKGTQPSGWKYSDGNAKDTTGTDNITQVEVRPNRDLKCHRKDRGA